MFLAFLLSPHIKSFFYDVDEKIIFLHAGESALELSICQEIKVKKDLKELINPFCGTLSLGCQGINFFPCFFVLLELKK